jgi:hypothetical protein
MGFLALANTTLSVGGIAAGNPLKSVDRQAEESIPTNPDPALREAMFALYYAATNKGSAREPRLRWQPRL